MSASEAALTAVVAASALHLGFQLTVTVLAYPALARVEDAAWADAHRAHSRAIVPLVVLTYGALVLALGWALLVARLSPPSPWLVAALAGASVSMLTTAVAAAPTHARLGRGRDAVLVRRLLVLDRVRTIGAVLCLVGAVGAVGAAVTAGG